MGEQTVWRGPSITMEFKQRVRLCPGFLWSVDIHVKDSGWMVLTSNGWVMKNSERCQPKR